MTFRYLFHVPLIKIYGPDSERVFGRTDVKPVYGSFQASVGDAIIDVKRRIVDDCFETVRSLRQENDFLRWDDFVYELGDLTQGDVLTERAMQSWLHCPRPRYSFAAIVIDCGTKSYDFDGPQPVRTIDKALVVLCL